MLLHKTLASLIIFAGTLFAVQPATSADLSGRWAGHWENNNNPHKGPLRANLKKINSDQYRATFSGRFFQGHSVSLQGDFGRRRRRSILCANEWPLSRWTAILSIHRHLNRQLAGYPLLVQTIPGKIRVEETQVDNDREGEARVFQSWHCL